MQRKLVKRMGKDARAARPHTPRQVRITCTPAKQVCRLYKNSMVQVVSDSERKIPEKIPRSVATVYFNCILYRFGTNAIQAVFQDFFTEWHIFRE